MFEEYQEKVLRDYKEKKEKKLLPQFDRITPALLKKEFVNILKERKEFEKDTLTLRAFFGPDERGRGYERIIEDFPTPSFRALSNFFREDKKPDRINTELIAWLIDYQPRPYAERDAYAISNPKSTHVDHHPPQEVLINNDENNQEEKPQHTNADLGENENVLIQDLSENDIPITLKKYNKTIVAFVGALLVVIGSYVGYKIFCNRSMHWVNDHYELIGLFEDRTGLNVVPLDEYQLDHQHKINRRDTVTESALGKVWYYKVNRDSIDLYTAAGPLPIDTNRRLLPLTVYMMNKYLRKN